MRGFVVAGTTSGVGKTTITSGLISALRARGCRVQPFKAGPDYIDPSYHARAAGRACRTLDSWMLPHDVLRALFAHASRDADIAVVEGVMGLFDGRSGEGEAGSTAEIAKLLGLPVILVVDAAKVARSVAAQVLGYRQFDADVRIAGVILNNVAGPGHSALCAEPIVAATGIPVLGALPRSDELRLPERHLGLIPTVEGRTAGGFFEAARAMVEEHVDLTALEAIAASAVLRAPVVGWEALHRPASKPERVRLAVAQDEAFSFIYPENLELLQAAGADIVPFSPLRETQLPHDASGVYLGGGFPELYAEALAANEPMLRSVRDAARMGLPIYAECGGLMYLGEALVDQAGRSHRMAGVVPVRSSMERTRLTLGYRTVRARADGPLLPAGRSVRGHEFHWSELDAPVPAATAAYQVVETGALEGYAKDNICASYIHLHFAADLSIAPRFVEACRIAPRRSAVL
ncbi:MAG TPA: cobyrinate a,c-diamide synthase [Dehalococcoidia bacterium]|nr:cobyrinate a,c-diamide synthase [Dehalococcoidia bacterium]